MSSCNCVVITSFLPFQSVRSDFRALEPEAIIRDTETWPRRILRQRSINLSDLKYALTSFRLRAYVKDDSNRIPQGKTSILIYIYMYISHSFSFYLKGPTHYQDPVSEPCVSKEDRHRRGWFQDFFTCDRLIFPETRLNDHFWFRMCSICGRI